MIGQDEISHHQTGMLKVPYSHEDPHCSASHGCHSGHGAHKMSHHTMLGLSSCAFSVVEGWIAI